MKDLRTPIEKYIDRFWAKKITALQEEEERTLSIQEIDETIHKFIHSLLVMGEDKFNHSCHQK